MENTPDITPFRDRRYQHVPIDKIKIINSRDRDEDQFATNVESIDHVGLLKPVRVNDKFLDRTGFYELICGEGRLLAHLRLGRTEIMAEVVTHKQSVAGSIRSAVGRRPRQGRPTVDAERR